MYSRHEAAHPHKEAFAMKCCCHHSAKVWVKIGKKEPVCHWAPACFNHNQNEPRQAKYSWFIWHDSPFQSKESSVIHTNVFPHHAWAHLQSVKRTSPGFNCSLLFKNKPWFSNSSLFSCQPPQITPLLSAGCEPSQWLFIYWPSSGNSGWLLSLPEDYQDLASCPPLE